MNKFLLAAVATLTLSSISVRASDPQGPETLDTGSLGEYYDPTLDTFSSTPPPSADIPSTDDFAAVFADVTGPSGEFGEEWLIPYDPNGSTLQFSMINDTTDSFTIFNAGYMLSPTLIPLDDLNFQSLPPDFAPLPALDGTQLSPSGTTAVVSLPEPGSFWLGGLAAVVFAVARFSRRQAQPQRG